MNSAIASILAAAALLRLLVGCLLIDFSFSAMQEFRPRLFQAYQRGKQTVSVSGTGLGLSISRKLMLSMNGDLWHEPRKIGSARFL